MGEQWERRNLNDTKECLECCERNAGKSAGKNAVRLPRLLVRRHARRSLAARRLLRLVRAGKTTEAASG